MLFRSDIARELQKEVPFRIEYYLDTTTEVVAADDLAPIKENKAEFHCCLANRRIMSAG